MKQSGVVPMGPIARKLAGIPRKRLWQFGFGMLILSSAGMFVLAVIPAAFPSVGASMADGLRSVVGPQPVALLESLSARMHDTLSRYLYRNGSPQIDWSVSTPWKEISNPSSSLTHALLAPKALPSRSPVVLVAPQLGWQAYGPTINGSNVMARALVSPDPYRPYAAVALVRMDLSHLQLHMMPGNQEPSRSSQVLQAFPSLGAIPADDQKNLIAAFNGGFKTVNGHYGMMVNGVTLLPARPNMGTIAVYRDSRVQIGAWGKDILPSADMVAYRQNCPPLIDAGRLNRDLAYNNRNEWGYTGNSDITWRTGLGITKNGGYLIYAVGNGTSALTLAQVLQQAGADAAIQLDINQYYAHFETYQPTALSNAQGFSFMAERLLDKMIDETNIYLAPNARDFFYLTAK